MAVNEEYEIHRGPQHIQGMRKISVYEDKLRAEKAMERLDNKYGARVHRLHTVQKEHQQPHWKQD